MKRYILTVFAVAACASSFAQDQFDAANFATGDLNGTARYVGLGGALDALGGDISVMGSNPAGTALFKKTDMAVTGSVLFTGEDGQLGHDRTRASFDQAGIVFSMNQYNKSKKGLQYTNFGINYQKKKNHFANADLVIEGLDGTLSQTHQIATMANASADNNYYGMLTALADEGALLNVEGEDTKTYFGVGAESAAYKRHTWGSTTQYDFHVSFNVSNQFFWGLNLGVYDIDYKRDAAYSEMGVDGVQYVFDNWYDTNGDGFDIKLGMIVRPFVNSPFRFGLTVHTPTWYRLEDCNGSTLSVYNSVAGNSQVWDSADPYEYKYRTPWKFGLSLGHTVGNFLALGAQYEVSDLSTCHYTSYDWDNDYYFDMMNDKIDNQLKAQHTLRLGVEVKPVENLAFRLGYNYVSSPIKENAWKETFYDGYNTETDFTVWKDTHRITCGVGYRFNGGYFDVAYQYQTQAGDFYAFDDTALKSTEIKNNRSQLSATLGFRF